jgi:hypothetical protein
MMQLARTLFNEIRIGGYSASHCFDSFASPPSKLILTNASRHCPASTPRGLAFVGLLMARQPYYYHAYRSCRLAYDCSRFKLQMPSNGSILRVKVGI